MGFKFGGGSRPCLVFLNVGILVVVLGAAGTKLPLPTGSDNLEVLNLVDIEEESTCDNLVDMSPVEVSPVEVSTVGIKVLLLTGSEIVFNLVDMEEAVELKV